jgi:aerobic-type carbon monoxide dehydrogenase small subunit (CoxS/CutS family)
MSARVQFTLNGEAVSLEVDRERPLLWVLRSDLGLTGTKWGCLEGLCGACTILVDGEAAHSCRSQVGDVEGKVVTTIEGLAEGERLHPLQQAFVEHDALQCGFCTPGMILGAQGLLSENPSPTRQQIVNAMDSHLCRCGAHTRILDAIESVARRGKGARP